MRRLGISLYPDTSQRADDRQYLLLAQQYGFTRVFTSLLQVTGTGHAASLAKLKATIADARELGFETIVDINPALFNELGIRYDDLHFFSELGASGLRLDEGFTGAEEARMTRNPYGLKIEINMSAGTNYLQSILSYHPQRENLWGCHNFYPQKYTGLADARFREYSRPYRAANIHTAAFVSAPSATTGPWPVHEGLPTLESDRARPLATQVTHLRMTGMVDDIIIANAYATETELAAVARAAAATVPTITVELIDALSDTERAIVLEGVAGEHLYRGDASEYLLRSTLPRVHYADASIPPRQGAANFTRGDVIVVNDAYARYKGELQIALRNFPNDGRRNVVGRITDTDMVLLDLLAPWMSFALKEVPRADGE